MPPSPEEIIQELRARNQMALIDLLNSDLDLAFSMLQTADMEIRPDPARVKEFLEKVKVTVETVRRLSGRIQDRGVWRQIHTRTDRLEADANALQRSSS